MSTFTKYREVNLLSGIWEGWSITRKIHFYLEWWCTVHYMASIKAGLHPKLSPSGYRWVLYQLPWYAKYISRLEFQFRYTYGYRPEGIVGRFPFFRRQQ